MKKKLFPVIILMIAMLIAGCGKEQSVGVRVGSLKGPTSIGLLNLMDKAEKGKTTDTYEFHMATGADELLPMLIKGELDIALIPANAAANLYQKEGYTHEKVIWRSRGTGTGCCSCCSSGKGG